MISLIAAMDRNRVMGKGNALPWHLPTDLRHFQRTTRGQTVIMDSLPEAFRPLPKRSNYVVSRSVPRSDGHDGAHTVPSLESAIDHCEGHGWIIGGAQLYTHALQAGLVKQMVLTQINHEFDGDVLFPQFDVTEWDIVSRQPCSEDEYPYEIVTYTKK
jgi:dihydrofolate reductase